MYTKSIVLEEITNQEYLERESFWKNRRRMDPFTVYCCITNPLVEEGYAKLMHRLLDHPYANELCVNLNGKMWVKRYANIITVPEVAMMADIAARNPQKKNFLEIKFQMGKGKAPRAVIGFTEHEGKLAGYEIFLHYSLSSLFDMRVRRGYRYAAGLWVPPEYCSGAEDLLTTSSGREEWQSQNAHTSEGAAAAVRST
jgi:hypothetical protein